MKRRADGERGKTMRQLVLHEEEMAGAEVIPLYDPTSNQPTSPASMPGSARAAAASMLRYDTCGARQRAACDATISHP